MCDGQSHTEQRTAFFQMLLFPCQYHSIGVHSYFFIYIPRYMLSAIDSGVKESTNKQTLKLTF
jgi:hypothetical protein